MSRKIMNTCFFKQFLYPISHSVNGSRSIGFLFVINNLSVLSSVLFSLRFVYSLRVVTAHSFFIFGEAFIVKDIHFSNLTRKFQQFQRWGHSNPYISYNDSFILKLKTEFNLVPLNSKSRHRAFTPKDMSISVSLSLSFSK